MLRAGGAEDRREREAHVNRELTSKGEGENLNDPRPNCFCC